MSEFTDAMAASDKEPPMGGDEKWRYGISIEIRSTGGKWRQDGSLDPSANPAG